MMPKIQKHYFDTQDSGINGIANIPAHWDTKRLKHVALLRLSNVDKKEKEGEPGVKLCNYTDVYNNERISSEIEFLSATATENQIAKFQLQKDDVIITKDSEAWNDIAIPAYVPSTLDGVICGYHLALVRPVRGIVLGRFLSYTLTSYGVREQFMVAAKGITRYGISKQDIGVVEVPIPSFFEQQAIANFLDHKTFEIDVIIADKEKLIKLLQEQRQAIITEAVTKGLNTNVPMKDSGVEWIGEIPGHWDIKKLKHICKINPSKKETNIADVVIEDKEVSFLPMEKIQSDGTLLLDETRQYSSINIGFTYFVENDVIVAKITPCFENGKGALCVNLKNRIGFGTTELYVLRAKKEILPKFLYYITRAHAFRTVGEAMMRGAAGQKRVPESFVSNYIIGLPPLTEQYAIINQIAERLATIDIIMNDAKTQIQKLKEYRQALIYEAVTGKIDVRD